MFDILASFGVLSHYDQLNCVVACLTRMQPCSQGLSPFCPLERDGVGKKETLETKFTCMRLAPA